MTGTSNLLSDDVSYLVKVLWRQKGLAGEIIQPLSVPLVVVQGKYRIDILPLSQLGRDRSSTFFSCSCDHVMDLSVSFGFGQGLVLKGFTGVLIGLNLSNAMQPVFDSSRLLASGQLNNVLRHTWT